MYVDEAERVRWALIAAAAAVVALLAGALLLTLGGSSQRSTYQVITTTQSTGLGPAQHVVDVSRSRLAQPAARTCQGSAGDESDPTGDDRPSVRRKARACPVNRHDGNAGDDQAGDRGGDNQAGDDQAGDRGGDNQAGDDHGAATNEP
jgi:hypothetical protein